MASFFLLNATNRGKRLIQIVATLECFVMLEVVPDDQNSIPECTFEVAPRQ
jgi:hypothetical protein